MWYPLCHMWAVNGIMEHVVNMNDHQQSDLCQREKRDPVAGSNPVSNNCESLSCSTV